LHLLTDAEKAEQAMVVAHIFSEGEAALAKSILKILGSNGYPGPRAKLAAISYRCRRAISRFDKMNEGGD